MQDTHQISQSPLSGGQDNPFGDRNWLKERLKRHSSELIRLSVPAVLMRLGLMLISMVDVALVGHYATKHLAWLNLANQSYVMFSIVIALGLLTGVIVYTATAFGRDDFAACGQIWRRTLPFSFGIGALMLLAALPGAFWLHLLGMDQESAEEAGRLIQILGLGLPGHVIFVTCSMFLEGIKRAHIGFYVMIIANILNLIFDYLLIYGAFGFPELGAAGSAWTSTIIRLVIAGLMMGYIYYAPSMAVYQLRDRSKIAFADWRDQRQLGYAAALSFLAEVAAFSGFAIFAGWLGTIPLAGHGVTYQLLGVPLMMAIGIGTAGSVRVGIAYGRRDMADSLLAALCAAILTLIIAGVFAILIGIFTKEGLSIFTNDPAIIALLLPLTALFTTAMIFDSFQMVISQLLHGLTETWWPTWLQSFAFLGVMLPASYWLAFTIDLGFYGLLWGMLIGVIVSSLLLSWRLFYVTRHNLKNEQAGD